MAVPSIVTTKPEGLIMPTRRPVAIVLPIAAADAMGRLGHCLVAAMRHRALLGAGGLTVIGAVLSIHMLGAW